MAKREIEPEAMDEELVETGAPTVGERLRAARSEKKMNLEDIAAQTRIPLRHLESIESSDWENLPAPTYTVGFAKSYAGAVGLDRTEIGELLREEMGGQRFATAQAEVFEAADPARTMPKWLVFGAVAAVILLIVVMSWLNRRSLDQTEVPAAPAATTVPARTAQPIAAPAQPAATQGPVVVTATGPAWIQIKDGGTTLFEGQMATGQTYAVPATAVAPLLRAGAPESLRITVGNAVAPPVGPAGRVTSNVSLKPADLMRGPVQPAPTGPTSPAPTPRTTTPPATQPAQ